MIGSFKENYIKHMANDAVGAGYTAVVFNYRGLGGAKLSVSQRLTNMTLLHCGMLLHADVVEVSSLHYMNVP